MVEANGPSAPDIDDAGTCKVCFELIEGEVKMCGKCNAIFCQDCIDKLRRDVCGGGCGAFTRKNDYVRCRPVEEIIQNLKLKKNMNCKKHDLEKSYFCMNEVC